MMDSDTWLGTLVEFWDELVHGEKVSKTIKILLAAVILGATVWSGYVFKQLTELTKPQIPPEVKPSPKVAQETKRLSQVVEKFQSTVQARGGSTELSVLASTISRKPFVPPPLPEVEKVGVASLVSEVAPPLVTVKAVIINEPNSVALLDVEGLGDGLIVKKGSPFGDGQGRVVAISGEKVVFTWAGQVYEASMEM